MKYLKRTICIVISVLLLASFTAYAADSFLTLNGFTFYIKDNGEAVIYEYEGSDADVVIPDTLLGAKVVMIDDYAFFGNNDIKSVSFENASELRSIGTNAFYGCASLKQLTVPASAELAFGSFQNCTGLESVVFENGVTSIPSQAFLGCSSLTCVEIPDSVTSIADNAFKNCPDVRILCSQGSYAMSYAESTDADCVVINVLKYGDINCDGYVNISDVSYIQLYRLGKFNPTERGLALADVTGDNKINVRDATAIQLHLVGRDTVFRTGTDAYI